MTYRELDPEVYDAALEILVCAPDLIQRYGWYHPTTKIGGVCAQSAMGHALNGPPCREAVNGAAFRAAYWAYRQAIGGVEYIPLWNDAPGRVEEEVLAAFGDAKRFLVRREENAS